MKVVVLAGGYSPERDVSLSSGCMISNALAEKGHAVVLVDAFLGIKEPAAGLLSLFKKNPDYVPCHYPIPTIPPDLEKMWAERKPDTGMFFGENVLEICRLADAVFLGLHGNAGENGQIQAAFDLLNIHYSGSCFSGCVLAMDKNLTKQILYANGLPTSPWVHIRDVHQPNYEKINKIGLPCVIKPANGGSSIGVSIATTIEELKDGIQKAAVCDKEIIIEKYLDGREFCVGILDQKTLPVIEIIPKDGWFDYEKKYQPGLTAEICPADISEELSEAMQQAAIKIHNVLKLGFYSRIDFKTDSSGDFYCLEANTLPGMTPNSLLPKEAAANHILYADLCNQIINHCN